MRGADNPITRGTPLQMTNIILDLAQRVGGINFGGGMVTQLNMGYGLVGIPPVITSGGTVQVNSNVIGTVVRVDAGPGLLGGPITRTGTLYVDTNNLPFAFPAAGTNAFAVTNGRTVTISAQTPERAIWRHQQTLYYPQEFETDTNVTILSLTVTNEGLYRLDFSGQFRFQFLSSPGYDGRYILGARWTDPAGAPRDELLMDLLTTVDYYDGLSNYSKTATYIFSCRTNTTLVLTNRMIVSSVGDGTGPTGGGCGTNYFRAALAQISP